MKKVVGISEVFSKITPVSKEVVLESGQAIIISKNLKRLWMLGKPLECEVCGCSGTHLQEHIREEQFTTWRVMCWSEEGKRQTFLTLDHIIPKSYGGTYELNNIRITCACCNLLRGNTLLASLSDDRSIALYQAVDVKKLRKLIQKKFSSYKKFNDRFRIFVNRFNRLVKRTNKITVNKVIETVQSLLDDALKAVGFKMKQNEIANVVKMITA
jgi:hypothetical protein